MKEEDNTSPAPREEAEEAGTLAQELQEVIDGDEDGEEKKKKIGNIMAKAWEHRGKVGWVLYWAVIVTAIAYIWGTKQVSGGLMKAGGGK